MTDPIDQRADPRAERALVAYVRQELSAPATAILGYAEMLMDDAVQAGRKQFTTDLENLLKEATLLLGRIDGLVTYSGGDAPPLEGAAHAPTEIATPTGAVESLLKAVHPIAESEAEFAAARPGRILVVDDNASNR